MLARKLSFISLVTAILVLACSATIGILTTPIPVQPATSAPQNTSDYFPLKQGVYWIYQGTVKWTKPNSSEVVEENITWKMEVTGVFQRNDIMGYEMSGAPWDLAWYQPGKERSMYWILQAGGKFYKVPLDRAAGLPTNGTGDLSSLLDDNNLFLDTPLGTGKKFCDSVSLARPDNMYCWVVGDTQPFVASGVNGVDPSRNLQEYAISNQTMPDISAIYFVPGVGISGYAYIHHGTVSEVDVHLIEYHSGE